MVSDRFKWVCLITTPNSDYILQKRKIIEFILVNIVHGQLSFTLQQKMYYIASNYCLSV